LYSIDGRKGNVKCVTGLGFGDPMSRHKLNSKVSRICRNDENLNSINQLKSLVGGNRITCATFVNDNLRYYQFVSVPYLPPAPRRKLARCDDDVSLLSSGDMPNNSRFHVHGRFVHCSLYPNACIHRVAGVEPPSGSG
jgi:hypothetical protein